MKRRDDLLQEIEEYNRDTAHLLLQAYERKYHEHLGYQSFGDYVDERWPTRDRIEICRLVCAAFMERLVREMFPPE